MIKVVINGVDVFVSRGSSVLEACKEVGINIPRFCYHDRLSVAGNCRMCLVEIEKSPKPVASCAMPVVASMVIFTDSPLVKKARENVLETLLLNHPLDCPICDQGGECDLQDQTRLFGGDYSRFYSLKRTVEDKYCGPLIKTIMTRCIHCTRCVRFATEIAGVDTLGTLNRGQDTEIGAYLDRVFETELSGNVIDLCPVGALTSKPYAFLTRPWELRTVESIDFTDSLGSNTYIDYKESEILRVLPRNNESINQDWISDKARFSADSVKNQRINEIFYKDCGSFSTLDWSKAFDLLSDKFRVSNVLFLVSSNLDLEAVLYLRQLSKKKNIRVKCLEASYITSLSLEFESFFEDIDVSDFCLLLGVNARIECSVLNIRLRSQWQKGGYLYNCVGSPYKSNTPLNFLSLGSSFLMDVLSGKSAFQRLISNSRMPAFISGHNFLNRFKFKFLYYTLKKINRNSRFFCINSSPNLLSLPFLGIKHCKSSDLRWCETVIGVNLDDNLKARKIFLFGDKFKVWMHSHGNLLASQSQLILPMSLPFEFEGVFLNSEGRPQRFNKVISPLKNSRPCSVFFRAAYSLLFSKIPLLKASYLLKLLENSLNFRALKFTRINFKLFTNLKIFGKTLLTTAPFKSNLEDFYLSNTYLKASRTMVQCSASFRSRSTNFI